jgi:sulfite reductase (NADPH) flavoprotein alpha-component
MSPESERLLAASAVLAAYAVFCGLIFWRAARRHRHAVPVAGAPGVPPMLVAYSSQTGFAEELAQRTAAVLQAGSVPVQVSDVAQLDGARWLWRVVRYSW